MCVAGIEVQCPMNAEFLSAGSRLRASRGNPEVHALNVKIAVYCCAEPKFACVLKMLSSKLSQHIFTVQED